MNFAQKYRFINTNPIDMAETDLLEMLNDYVPADEFEWTMWLNTIAFVESQPRCFERTLAVGHVTASAWVVSPDRERVLMMHHRKLDRWFQPGGHCDGNPDTLQVALKEVREETGVAARPLRQGIFDIDVHTIPGNSREAAHLHYDIRYLLEADPALEVARNHEAKAVRWVPLDEVRLYNPSESLLRMRRKDIVNI